MNGKNDGAAIIEKKVLIGAYAIILGNVIIGENFIIGAGTIVLNDIPANTKVMGTINNRLVEMDDD